MDDLNPNNDDNKIYETEPGAGENAAGFSAQSQKDKFLGGPTEKEEVKPVDNLDRDDIVSVVRSEGIVEDGWRIDRFENGGKAIVQSSTKEGVVLEKQVPPVELYAINRPNDTDHPITFENWKELWERAGGGTISMPEGTRLPERLTPKQAREFFRNQPLVPEPQTPSGKVSPDSYKMELRAAAFGRGLTQKEIRQTSGT